MGYLLLICLKFALKWCGVTLLNDCSSSSTCCVTEIQTGCFVCAGSGEWVGDPCLPGAGGESGSDQDSVTQRHTWGGVATDQSTVHFCAGWHKFHRSGQ